MPGFGDPAARLLVVGLAPAANGGNRTGRVFTGDSSGDFLFAALYRAGFASQARSVSKDDGLALREAWIAAAVRCAPPDNRPTPAEFARCQPFLAREIAALTNVRVVLALGALAWRSTLAALVQTGIAVPRPAPAFAHGARVDLGRVVLFGSYHVSRQNTNTGRLTKAMFDAVLKRVKHALSRCVSATMKQNTGTFALLALAAFVTLSSRSAPAQPYYLPASGDNQRATVTQQVGPVTVTISYSSPRVVLKGDDRRGKIWGKLVPYGLTQLDFNDCKSCPWRAGANENTVFTVSDEVKVQGKSLPAGTYGLFAITGPDEWTFIFSKNASSWGAYWYDPKEDVLRVTAKPAKSEYHEWLTYDFVEREPAKATVALKWEELQVPFAITVDDVPARWVARLRAELRGYTGFAWETWQRAADYCLQNKINLPEALDWAERATGPNFGGASEVQALSTLARAQSANGREADATKTWDKAISLPGATAIQIHQVGRSLLAEGKKEQALRIFQTNAKRFPDQWPVHVGLMRGYAATGDTKKALEGARLALKQAPDEGNRKNLENQIKLLEAGKNIN